MVTPNPFTAGNWPKVVKFNTTVIYDMPARAASGMYWTATSLRRDIWPEVLLFTLIATMVVTVTDFTDRDLGISDALLTVLGTVLGLVISFRTSSAYDMYQEGRKLWTNITLASRNLGQLLWIHVPVDRPLNIKLGNKGDDSDEQKRVASLKCVIEKRSMINLVQAFSVAVKHFLRGESGIHYRDLYPLISFLPRHTTHPSLEPKPHDTLPMWIHHEKLLQRSRTYASEFHLNTLESKSHTPRKDSFDPEKALPRVDSDVPLREARNPPKKTIYDYLPLLFVLRPIIWGPLRLYRRMFKKRDDNPLDPEVPGNRGLTGKKRPPPPVDSNIPLEITLFLHSYVHFLLHKGLVDPAIATALVDNLCSFQDVVTNLERVCNTPIPFAYQAHLRISLWIYLALLPFQIVSTLNWLTIPATSFASFLLVGFLEIGHEIENPFGYDENDLPLDTFCLAIQRELHEITAHPAPDPHNYIFGPHNQPFAPADCLSAEEIITDLNHEYHGPTTGMDSVRRTLLKSWRTVEEVTREKR